MNIKDALKKELINYLENSGVESDLAKKVAEPNEEYGYSNIPDDLKMKLQKFADEEVKQFNIIEQVIDEYKKSTNKSAKDDLYEIIDLWSMQWVPFWYHKFADSANLQMDEFISEYRMIVLEAVDKFTIDWNKPNKDGLVRKAHMNGLLYMMLGQRFINNINKQYRAKRRPSIMCPHCSDWVTLVNNKHCQEKHGHSLYDFMETYPGYPLSSGIGSLDESIGDEFGVSLGDFISRNDDETSIFEIVDSISQYLSDKEYDKIKGIFDGYAKISKKEIIRALVENTNIVNTIQNITM